MVRGDRQGPQDVFDVGALGFEPRRQFETRTQIFDLFVHREARPGRGQFYNVAVGIVGIDASEVNPIQYRRNLQPGPD